MKYPKLLVCDIDGTLVSDDKRVLDSTRETIDRLKKEGTLFMIASGKPCFQILRLNEDWKFETDIDAFIGMNGAELFDTHDHSMVTSDLLDEEVIREITEIMKPFTHGNAMIYEDDHILYAYKDEKSELSGKRNALPVEYAEDLSRFYRKKNAKILYRFDKAENLDACKAYLDRLHFDNFYYFNSQTTMLEFTHPKVNKVNALKVYCEKMGFEKDEVLVFGDMSNDDRMLEWADHSVCLINGHPETKKIAKEITLLDNNHDGVGDYIRRTYGI